MANNNKESITADELKRLGDALKDDKFRELLLEYAEEIRDPQNRMRYEQELAILERERGVDLTFVHPEAGYVLKTSARNGAKTFLNICKNRIVAKPSCSRSKVKAGLDWSVPYFLSPSRDDVDKSGHKCIIFDVVFHPDTIYMSQRNARFRKMIEDTALDGIQQKFSVYLDRKNVSYPKLKYKGQPFPTVLRKPITDSSVTEISNKLENTTLSCLENNVAEQDVNGIKTFSQEKLPTEFAIEPKYSMRYRNNIDMKDFTVIVQKSPNLRPDEIVIEIQLPLIDSAKGIDIDIIQQTLVLKSTGQVNYKLDVALPFPVDNEQGKAQFDQSKRTLTVTLPVKPFEEPKEAEREKENEDAAIVETAKELQRKCDVDDDFNHTHHHCTMGNLCLPSHAYDLPMFTVNQSTETVTFLFHIPEVHTESIETQICECGHGFQVVFTSVADKNWYSFCVTSENRIEMKELESDVSVSNMALRAYKADNNDWTKFDYGCYEAMGYSYCFTNMHNILEKFNKLKDGTEIFLNQAIPVASENVCVKDVTEDSLQLQVELSSVSHFSSEADTEDDPNDNGQVEVQRKCRTSSESSIDLCPLPSRRGILKYPRNWRSISESSDDLNCGSPLDMLPPSPEEDDYLSADKMPKKNVRFNDFVSKNIFRANSSILGQKKKNQKRAQNKRRVAAQRSSSQEESESHDSTATTEEDSEHIQKNGIQLEKPKKKKCRSKSENNNRQRNNLSKTVSNSDEIVDLLVDKCKEEQELVINSENVAENTVSGLNNNNTVQIINEANEEYLNEDNALDSEKYQVFQQDSDHLYEATTFLVEGNPSEIPEEQHSLFPENSVYNKESSFVKQQDVGELKSSVVNDDEMLENNQINCENKFVCEERTCSEMSFNLDFRTNSEGILEISLPPDNTAFHLD